MLQVFGYYLCNMFSAETFIVSFYFVGIPENSSRLLALRGVIKKLPPANHEVLRYLSTHLYKYVHLFTTIQLNYSGYICQPIIAIMTIVLNSSGFQLNMSAKICGYFNFDRMQTGRNKNEEMQNIVWVIEYSP